MTELPIAGGTDPMVLLLDIMRQLRDPDSGCPWDLRQDFHTIVPFTIEETYELADAIASGDFSQVCDELGDVLFQVVFYAQMASERRLFDFADVAEGIAQKLLRRHPHVFARNGRPATTVLNNSAAVRGKSWNAWACG